MQLSVSFQFNARNLVISYHSGAFEQAKKRALEVRESTLQLLTSRPVEYE